MKLGSKWDEVERYLKRFLKKKIKISSSLIIAYLMTGAFSYSGNVWVEADAVKDENAGKINGYVQLNWSTTVYDEGIDHNVRTKMNPNEIILLADKSNKLGINTTFENQHALRSVIIGSRAVVGGNDATAIGYRAAVGINSNSNNHKDSHQGTAVGYRTFARGLESISLGNDSVAWGSSSIAIGSDNAGADGKKLPKDIFFLFLQSRDDFNYTGEYPAVDFKDEKINNNALWKDGGIIDVNGNKLFKEGKLYAKDGQPLTFKNGIAIRKKDKADFNEYYYYDNENFYESKQGEKFLIKITDQKTIDEIKSLPDYTRKVELDKIIEEAYKKYLDENNERKKLKEQAAKDKGKTLIYDNTRTHTWARGNNAVAIGARSIAYGNNSTALGTLAIAVKDHALALGSNTIAFGLKTLAVGNNTYVYSDESVGVGNNVQAINKGSMVYGSNSYSGGLGSLALGDHTFANVTMNEGQVEIELENTDRDSLYRKGDTRTLQNNASKFFVAKTTTQKGTGEEKAEQSKGNDPQIPENQGAVAIGSYSIALGDNALSLGRYSYAKDDNTVAIGKFAFADKDSSFAMGSFTRALGQRSIAIGVSSASAAPDSVAFGIRAGVDEYISDELLINKDRKEEVKNAMAIGNYSHASYPNSIALGVYSKTDYSQKEMETAAWAPKDLGFIPSSKKIGYLSVGAKNYERRIVNVAGGAFDTDVPNIGQLKALEDAIRYGMNDDESDVTQGSSSGHYLSVRTSEEIVKYVSKVQDYDRYIKYKKDYLKHLAKNVINGEELDLTKYKEKIDKLEKKYTKNDENNGFQEIASNLNSITEETLKNTYKVEEKKEDESEEEYNNRKWKKVLEAIKKIDEDYEKDNQKAQKDKLLTEQQKKDVEKSNYNNDGAKAYGTIAFGVGASVNASKSIVIGNDSVIDDSKYMNTILLGNKTRATAANAVALGNESVADRVGIKYTDVLKGKASSVYLTEEDLAYYDKFVYGGISVGASGDDFEKMKQIQDTKDEIDRLKKSKTEENKDKHSEIDKQIEEKEKSVKRIILRQIANVAPATKDTDAVIFRQLREAMKSTMFMIGNTAVQPKNIKIENYISQGPLADVTPKDDIYIKFEKDKAGTGDYKLTFALNKSESVAKKDPRVITSDAVHKAIEELREDLVKKIEDEKLIIVDGKTKKSDEAPQKPQDTQPVVATVSQPQDGQPVEDNKVTENQPETKVVETQTPPPTTKKNEFIITEQGKEDDNYSGSNLTTKKIEEDKLEIGFKKKPTFEEITISSNDNSIVINDGTIKGLKDPTDDTHAVNKSYVDSKLSDLTLAIPVEYKHKDGIELEIGKDGKIHKKGDKNSEVKSSDLIVKVKGDTPIKFGNVASGLGINEGLTTIQQEVERLQGEVAKKQEELSNKEQEIDALNKKQLELTQSPEENKDEIAKNENKLSQYNGEKEILIAQVAEVQAQLTERQKELKDAPKMDDIIKKLVGGDLEANKNNIATVEDLKALATAGITVQGNEGEAKTVKISDTLNVKGTGNVKVVSGTDGLTISMDSKLTGVDSITMDKVKISKGGLDNGGNRITKVADGVEADDAVSLGQLNKANSKLSSQVASAIAIANIPQLAENQTFSIGAATGYSDKEYAIAVGISGTEKTNKFIYKLSAGIDSQKNVSVGAGFNYNFGKKAKSSDEVSKLKNEIAQLKQKSENDLNNLKKQVEQLLKSNNSQKAYKTLTGFKTDEYKLTDAQIKEVQEFLKDVDVNRTLEIIGYTDIVGNDKYNLDLGYKRAIEVANIATKLGYKNISIKSSGFNTIADNKTNFGNRRVEINVK